MRSLHEAKLNTAPEINSITLLANECTSGTRNEVKTERTEQNKRKTKTKEKKISIKIDEFRHADLKMTALCIMIN